MVYKSELMKLTPTPLSGVFAVSPKFHEDERGTFIETWNAKTFAKNLNVTFIRSAISQNPKQYTLRGMHFQNSPHAEAKLISISQGSIFDVIIDLRPESKTFKKWFGTQLDSKKSESLFIPQGFAHGFLTLEDYTVVNYLLSEEFVEASGSGIRWNDPTFNISWPHEPSLISPKDRDFLNFKI